MTLTTTTICLSVQIISLAADIYIPRVTKANKTKNLLGGPRNYQSLYVTKKDCSASGKPPSGPTVTIYQIYICPAKKKVKSIIRSAQSAYESKLIQRSQTHPRALYDYMNSKL